MTTHYSTGQKICLAGMVIGSIMCVVGAGAPYWIVSDPQGFGVVGNLVSRLVKGSFGLFMYCIDVELVGNSGCRFFPLENFSVSGWYYSTRAAGALCAVLGGLCGFTALCLACCSCCRRLIALGIFAFLAAVAGAYTAVVFARNTEVYTDSILGFQLTSYGWAFYVFCVGTGILGLVSFIACFAAPDNHVHQGIVMSQPAANPMVFTTATVQQPPHMYHQPQAAPFGMANPSADPNLTVVTTSE